MLQRSQVKVVSAGFSGASDVLVMLAEVTATAWMTGTAGNSGPREGNTADIATGTSLITVDRSG